MSLDRGGELALGLLRRAGRSKRQRHFGGDAFARVSLALPNPTARARTGDTGASPLSGGRTGSRKQTATNHRTIVNLSRWSFDVSPVVGSLAVM